MQVFQAQALGLSPSPRWGQPVPQAGADASTAQERVMGPELSSPIGEALPKRGQVAVLDPTEAMDGRRFAARGSGADHGVQVWAGSRASSSPEPASLTCTHTHPSRRTRQA